MSSFDRVMGQISANLNNIVLTVVLLVLKHLVRFRRLTASPPPPLLGRCPLSPQLEQPPPPPAPVWQQLLEQLALPLLILPEEYLLISTFEFSHFIQRIG